MEDLLLQVASKSDMNLQYACVIMHRNKVISTGFNYYDIKKIHANQSSILRAL